jgi:hypothetical protein
MHCDVVKINSNISFGLNSLGTSRSKNEEDLQDGPTLKKIEHIREEITDLYYGGYIISNERFPYFYAKVIQSAKETLISVGTFRALIDFTMGSFDRAILLDIDRAVCDFNREHLHLFKEISLIKGLSVAEQRYQYLAALHGQWLSKDKLKTYPNIDKLINELEYQLDLWDFRPENLPVEAMPVEVRSIIQNMMSIGKKIDYGYGDKWLLAVGRSFYRVYFSCSWSKSYYWQDDDKWCRIVSAINQGHISVVQGNVAGEQTMPSIVSILSSSQENVSVIDISNIPDYLSENDTDKLIGNLKHLPLASQAFLLFTNYDKNLGETIEIPRAGETVLDRLGYFYLPNDQFEKIKRIAGGKIYPAQS